MQYPLTCTFDCDTQERYIKKNEIKKKCFTTAFYFDNTHKEKKKIFSKMYYCYKLFQIQVFILI